MNRYMKILKSRKFKIFCVIFVVLVVLAVFFVVISNLYIINKEKDRIIDEDSASEKNADCILILGAGVWGSDTPSPMLADRLDEGIKLYESKAAPKILVSGDHGTEEYDEVNVMKNYLCDAGVPSEDVFMDHAGFSTYESIYRAKEIFGVDSMIVVTQDYHMYRALYICEKLGIEGYGVTANPREYAGQIMRNVREWIARDKEILNCIIKPEPTYLGDKIDITANGDVTND